MHLLTNSRMKAARACRRLHKYRYLLRMRPALDALVLRFGTLVHKGLEAWWKAKQAGLPQEEWLRLAMVAMSGESDAFDLARAQVLLAGYHLRWKDEPYEVLAVEVPFECALRNPITGRSSRTWRLAGKIDVVVRDLRTGLVLTVEHKTSAEDISQGSDYWKRLRLDGQVSTYYEGAASLGYDVAGCLYDVLHKPQHRPGTVNTKRKVAETPEEFRERIGIAVAEDPTRYFQRGEVVRLESELREALYDSWQLGQSLHEEEAEDIAPRNVDQCVRYGRTCEFFGVCSGEASLDDTSRFVRLEDVHPELSERESKEEVCQTQQ